MTAHIDAIKAAMETVWPSVKEGIALQAARAGARRMPGLNRRIVEQTMWALSKAEMLLSPERTTVIEQAKIWAAFDCEAATPDQIAEQDELLLQAVEKLP